MTFQRRTALTGIAATALATALPAMVFAQAGGTLEQAKQRGSLRVGVTQAPPWYSKDPKTGEWASGVGVSMGRAMAAALGVKFEPVEVTWGTAIAALQGNKIDIMYMMDATPERAQAVDFPESPLLYYSLAVLARDDLPVKAWADLNKAGVRIAVPQASSMDKFLSENTPNATIQRFPGNGEAIAAPTPSACSTRRCWRRARSWAAARSSCPHRPGRRPPAPRCARKTRPSWLSWTSSWPSTTRAARRRNGTKSS